MAIQSARRLGQGPLPITRRRFFIQTILIQALLFGVAVTAAWRTGVPLAVAPPHGVLPWLIAAALVLLGVLLLRWRWSSRTTANKYRLYSILPHSASEFPSYLVLCLAAGIGEEVVYRGMLFAILAYLTGSQVAAVLIASVVFAVAHAVQGLRGVFAIFLIALAAHGLVLFAHSLLPAIFAHTVYDAIAGWLIPRLYERDMPEAAALTEG
jgi:membrane protease YdiL (CAAX protease family)